MQRPDIPAGLPDDIQDKKWAATTWFESLRDNICMALENLEEDRLDPAPKAAGRFERTPWQRDNGAGGGGGCR